MMHPAMSATSIRALAVAVRRRVRLAAGAALAVTVVFALPVHATEDFPPPISPPGSGEAGTLHDAQDPRGAQAAAAPASASTSPAAADAAAPATAGASRPAVKPQRDVQIEQKHVGRRLSEVVVTPAGFTYQYTMINLEGQDSGSPLQPHPGLSIPRFFRFDF